MKPKVLIVTKFYYRRGGDCVAALNLERLLREQGHEVAVFAMNYSGNIDSPWKKYWPAEVSFTGGAKAKIAAMRRMMGNGDVVSCFKKIMADFRPDVVHLHNIHSYLSPVVARIASKQGARVFWTLHDYKLACPAYACLRQGNVCELCFSNKRQVLSTRCMKGSLAASAMAYMEALRWSGKKLQRYTRRFICPSAFMAAKMQQARFAPDKLATLCNFISPEMLQAYSGATSYPRQDYYCYVGRLSEEKGVRTLLDAASRLPYALKIAGGGPLLEELKQKYAGNPSIHFLGMLDAPQITDLLSGARLSVLPSEWYENNPLGVIESLCAGTPVVGADIGGIPELITPASGIVYPSGDADALMSAISTVWSRTYDHEAIAAAARQSFSPLAHYRRLMEIYAS